MMTDYANYLNGWEAGYTEGEKAAATKWIPTSVLLPTKEGAYLVTVEYRGCDGKKKTVISSDWCKLGFRVSYIFSEARVTAWMPKPKPYDEEEKK